MLSIITTTVSSKSDALLLGKQLIDAHLVACTHISEIVSQYYWKDEFHEEKEYQVSFKTSQAKREQAIKSIKANHPFEVPMIISNELQVNNSYKGWMDQYLR